MNPIGIRREDKSEWEARVPLVPDDVRTLISDQSLKFRVQSSTTRAFSDDLYRAAGAEIVDDLSDCPIIMGVKEIPPEKLEANKTYIYFSHTIKGQAANMPTLKRLMDLDCQLIDYERIIDDERRRLVFFGRFAGLAGMIDTLWTLGRRLTHEGIETPFAEIEPAHRYQTLEHAKQAIGKVGEAIKEQGLPDAFGSLVCGFAGYGQVSTGAQEIFDLLPVREVAPEELSSAITGPRAPAHSDVRSQKTAQARHQQAGLPGRIAAACGSGGGKTCTKVVFREEHMVRRIDKSTAQRHLPTAFNLQEYYDHPERYEADFFRHVPYLNVLVNCIYWEPKYPRLITREQFKELYSPHRAAGFSLRGHSRRIKPSAQNDKRSLRVIGDISCDIDGSLACTTRATDPGNPVYVYDPQTGETTDGVIGNGPVVLAVDFLPCELPVDASNVFSATLTPFIAAMANADFSHNLDESGLSPELQRATILQHGELTHTYRYLESHLQ